MLYRDLKPILYNEDKELFDKIFDNGHFSLSDAEITVDQKSLYDSRDLEEIESSAKTFGCIIRDDNINIPMLLPFYIYRSTDQYSDLIIKRNGVEFYPQFIDDTLDFTVVYTEFGSKIAAYAKNKQLNILDAYKDLVATKQLFGV